MSAEHLLRAEAHERGGRKLVVPQGAGMEAGEQHWQTCLFLGEANAS